MVQCGIIRVQAGVNFEVCLYVGPQPREHTKRVSRVNSFGLCIFFVEYMIDCDIIAAVDLALVFS